MPRRNWEDGVEIVREDLNAAPTAMQRELYDRYLKELVQGVTDAFFGNGMKISYATSTSVTVAAGLGVQEDSSQTSPEPTQRPIYQAASDTLNISSPDASLDRIDIVCVRATVANELTATRKKKDASTSAITNETLTVQKDWEAEFQIVAGTPDASPSAPATPSGWLKIAELAVTAVSGMSGAGAVTDTRTAMPIGGAVAIDSSAFVKLTAGASTPVSTLLAELDALAKNPEPEYSDYDNLGSVPGSPSAGKLRFYFTGGLAYTKDSSGTITPIGSGGGGAGGLRWNSVDGSDVPEEEEFGELVYKFADSGGQTLQTYLKVPNSYLAGRQIKMKLALYSPSTGDNVLLRTTSSLIRKNNDAITDETNQRVSTNTELTNSVANQYREIECDITDSSGAINSVAVSAGDLIKVELSRVVGSESSSDSAETRFLPSATEASFV